MTIYVSELPKSCRECFCNVEDTWCALSDGEMGDICEECDNKTRHKKCPLLSLAEHNKQVRKEVCDEIREKSYKDSELYDLPSGGISERSTYLINEHILDQIQNKD